MQIKESATGTDIESIVKSQHNYFATHCTKSLNFRMENLKKFKSVIIKYDNKMIRSVKTLEN